MIYCADGADVAAIMRVGVVLYLIRIQVCACSFYHFTVAPYIHGTWPGTWADGSSKAYKNI